MFSTLRLRARLGLGFGLLTATVLGVSALSLFGLGRADTAFRRLRRRHLHPDVARKPAAPRRRFPRSSA